MLEALGIVVVVARDSVSTTQAGKWGCYSSWSPPPPPPPPPPPLLVIMKSTRCESENKVQLAVASTAGKVGRSQKKIPGPWKTGPSSMVANMTASSSCHQHCYGSCDYSWYPHSHLSNIASLRRFQNANSPSKKSPWLSRLESKNTRCREAGAAAPASGSEVLGTLCGIQFHVHQNQMRRRTTCTGPLAGGQDHSKRSRCRRMWRLFTSGKHARRS